MKQWLTIVAISPLLAAAPALGETGTAPAHWSTRERAVKFRLLEERSFDPAPIPNWGIGPDAALSSKSSLGLGLVHADSTPPDGRLYGRVPRSSSPALNYRLRF